MSRYIGWRIPSDNNLKNKHMKNTSLMISFLFFLFPILGQEKPVDKKLRKELLGFNYIIGTQTVGAKYKFTSETNLVETAKAIRAMGSNLLKFSMSPRYCTENYDIPEDKSIQSLADLAREKSVKEVLDMKFKYYHIWAYEFSQYTPEPKGEKRDEYQIKFINGLNDDYAAKSYKEIYDLAVYLLKTYSGTGKVFLLGNWEGDWHLRWDYDRNKPANNKTIEGMTRWFNLRQQAIDDAKKETPHKNVDLYHYVELNLSDLALKGEACVTNSILPHINPDYVSFSAYTATNPPKNEQQMRESMQTHLNYIESKIQPKSGIKGKRLFIGEYGWAEADYTQAEIDKRAKWVIKYAIEWGCPYILFWEMYNNEIKPDGTQKGFWLINNNNKRTKLYQTHRLFYKEVSEYITKKWNETGKMPTDEEFRKDAVQFNSLK